MDGKGLQSKFAFPYVGARPRAILKISEATEAKVKIVYGWAGVGQDQSPNDKFVIEQVDDVDVTPTDYADTPIGTEIKSNYGAHSRTFVHKSKSDPAVVGDWEVYTAATAS